MPDRRGFLGGVLASLAVPFVPKPTQPGAHATIRAVRATANLKPWPGISSGYNGAIASVMSPDISIGRPGSPAMDGPGLQRHHVHNSVGRPDCVTRLADEDLRLLVLENRRLSLFHPIYVTGTVEPTYVHRMDTDARKFDDWRLR